MKTVVFDGRPAAAEIKEELQKEASEKNLKPFLAVILVGENPSSLSYINQKQKACRDLGWDFELHQLSENSTFDELKQKILFLNHQSSIDGLILQLPLPSSLKIPSYELTSYILPAKDIDGLGPQSPFTPPTALAVEYVLDREKIKIEGSKAVVLGRGPTSGRPIADLLFKRGAKVFVLHSQSQPSEVRSQLLSADIIVSCVGKPNLIKGDMIKEGAVVIGVGISRLPESECARRADSGSLVCGDLDEPSFLGKARLITPTPGGIGPLTVAFLLENLLKASKKDS